MTRSTTVALVTSVIVATIAVATLVASLLIFGGPRGLLSRPEDGPRKLIEWVKDSPDWPRYNEESIVEHALELCDELDADPEGTANFREQFYAIAGGRMGRASAALDHATVTYVCPDHIHLL